jgi:hypothetical protein
LKKLSNLGPIQISEESRKLAQKYNAVVRGFESPTSRKNFSYACKLLDDAHEHELQADRKRMPEDRRSHEPVLYKAELLHGMGLTDDVEALLVGEHERFKSQGRDAHGLIYLMLVAVYTNDKNFDAAIDLLEIILDDYPEFHTLEHAPGQNAERMLELVKGQKYKHIMSEERRRNKQRLDI